PKPSTVSQEAIEKARLSIQKVPQKRSLLDTLVELHEYVLNLIQQQILTTCLVKITRSGVKKIWQSSTSKSEGNFLKSLSLIYRPRKSILNRLGSRRVVLSLLQSVRRLIMFPLTGMMMLFMLHPNEFNSNSF
ncbi:hypothetical protein BYT27DRAFT_7086740, partial [Phlegmacium glaucopus]